MRDQVSAEGRFSPRQTPLGCAGLREPQEPLPLLMPSLLPLRILSIHSPLRDSTVSVNYVPCLHRSMSLTNSLMERFITALSSGKTPAPNNPGFCPCCLSSCPNELSLQNRLCSMQTRAGHAHHQPSAHSMSTTASFSYRSQVLDQLCLSVPW